MPGPDYCRSVTGRASAVLTTGEVAGNAIDTKEAQDGALTLDFSFTIGSLTNVTLRLYGSVDNGTTYRLMQDASGQEAEYVYTASTDRTIQIPHCPGCQKVRASVQGSGTVTSSLCDFDYHYLRRGSQS